MKKTNLLTPATGNLLPQRLRKEEQPIFSTRRTSPGPILLFLPGASLRARLTPSPTIERMGSSVVVPTKVYFKMIGT